jgi:putative transposase
VARRKLQPADRALLAALSRVLPRSRWSCFFARPDMLLRWHRRLVAGAWTYPHRGTGRPPLDQELQQLIIRLASESPRWGYQRIKGELLRLGIHVSATAIRTTLRRHGLDPTPRPTTTTWRAFLRRQAAGIVACDLLHRRHRLAAKTLRLVLHRRGHSPGPPGRGDRQSQRRLGDPAGPHLLLRLEDQERRVRFLIRDRDGKFCRGFDDVFCTEGAKVLVTPVQAPNANAYAERWVRTVRSECLDWLLIVGRGHLEQVLRIYVRHDNEHRPHRALGLESPSPSARPTLISEARRGRVRRRDLLGGTLHEYHQAA